MEPLRTRRLLLLILSIILILGLTLVLFSPKYSSFFTRDDFVWLDYAREGASDIFSTSISGFFMPVPKVFFLCGLNVFGTNPVPYNVINVVLHLTAILLLMLFIYRLVPGSGAAIAGGAVFALSYPAYEAVSWISAVVWQLTVLTFIATALSYLAFRTGTNPSAPPGGSPTPEHEHDKEKRWLLYALSLVFFITALLTKEAAITIPVILLLLEWIFVEDILERGRFRRWKTGVKYVIPFFALGAVYGIAQLLVQSSNPLIKTGTWSLGGHVISNFSKFINWLFLIPPESPSGSTFFTQGAGGTLLRVLQVTGYVAIPIVFLVVIVYGNKTERFAVGWIIVTILPVALFGTGPSSRYVYLPSVGFAVLFGEVAAVRVWKGLKGRNCLRGGVAAAMVFFVVLSSLGLYVGAKRFADRTQLDRNLARQLERIDLSATKGQKIKLVGVPHVVADQNGITSMVRLYCSNLEPDQEAPETEEGLLVYEYLEPDGRLVQLR